MLTETSSNVCGRVSQSIVPKILPRQLYQRSCQSIKIMLATHLGRNLLELCHLKRRGRSQWNDFCKNHIDNCMNL